MSESNASRRSSTVQSFKVMDVLQRANQLESQGKTIYHCEVGQPESGAVSLLRTNRHTYLLQHAVFSIDSIAHNPHI